MATTMPQYQAPPPSTIVPYTSGASSPYTSASQDAVNAAQQRGFGAPPGYMFNEDGWVVQDPNYSAPLMNTTLGQRQGIDMNSIMRNAGISGLPSSVQPPPAMQSQYVPRAQPAGLASLMNKASLMQGLMQSRFAPKQGT